LKKRKGNLSAAIVLIAIVAFLAADAGFALYKPDRLALSSPFCVLDIIHGDVFVMKKDALAWEAAADGMILEPGTRVKTAADAHASVTFTRGTTTKLEPGTDLIVDKIEESQDAQPYTVVLKQQLGKTWNQVDKADGNTSFQIRTASADIQVHGTLFTTEVDATGKTTVQTTEGRVGVSAGGQEVQVPAGKMTEVAPHGTPSAPASIPPARNELVITVNNPAFGLVKDPSGSSTGYLNTGAKVNQISGSSVAVAEESSQTIRIREPEAGEYTLMLRGVADGTGEITVEGFVEGKSTFRQIASCNITAAKETLLKLHYDVIDGLLQRQSPSDQGIPAGNAALASELSAKTTADGKSGKIQPAPEDTHQTPEALSKQEGPADGGFSWFGGDKSGQLTRWMTVGIFLFLIGIVFLIWRRNN
jgi:hypothetical protein